VRTAVTNAKGGQVRYRADKGGIIHSSIGKASFEVSALRENLLTLVDSLRKAKPATSKGVYIRKVSVSPTMGPGVPVDPGTLG